MISAPLTLRARAPLIDPVQPRPRAASHLTSNLSARFLARARTYPASCMRYSETFKRRLSIRLVPEGCKCGRTSPTALIETTYRSLIS